MTSEPKLSQKGREEWHKMFREKDLVDILNRFREGAPSDLERAIARFGTEVKKGANHELMLNMGGPLENHDRLYGYLALMYEAENDVRIEDELSMLEAK